MMKAFYLGASALALCAAAPVAPAAAADIYRAPEAAGPGGYKDAPYVQSWTGWYVGVNGGGIWTAKDSTVTAIDIDVFAGALTTNTSSARFNDSSGFGGGQIGYNWQGMWHPRLVLGVEADFQGAGLCAKGSTSAADANSPNEPFDGPTNASAKSCLNWFGTVRGRLGYAFDRALVYGTGGFAFGSVKDSLATSKVSEAEVLTTSASRSSTDTGYVVGGGLEYALSPAWSLKGEYQYINLGTVDLKPGLNTFDPADFTGGSAHLDHTYHTVRLGLNYHILPGYEPLK
jgi:outer membrane immunogenic protein